MLKTLRNKTTAVAALKMTAGQRSVTTQFRGSTVKNLISAVILTGRIASIKYLHKFELRAFFISNAFKSNTRLKFAKIKQILSKIQRLNFWRFKIIRIFHPRYQPRVIWRILKNKQKNKRICVRLFIMKMKIKMKKDHKDTITKES